MKIRLQILLSLAFCFVTIPAVSAQTGVNGVFENLTANKQSGDLDGWRIAIFSAGNGYWAIVQQAQGGAEDPKPVLVEVTVKGKTISFMLNETKYSGTVSAKSLKLKAEGDPSETIKRVSSAGYFK